MRREARSLVEAQKRVKGTGKSAWVVVSCVFSPTTTFFSQERKNIKGHWVFTYPYTNIVMKHGD